MTLLLIIFLNCFFNFIEGNNVNLLILYPHILNIQFLKLIPKSRIRQLWEEEPSYDREGDDEVKKSIEEYYKGPFTDYKYNIFYEVEKIIHLLKIQI